MYTYYFEKLDVFQNTRKLVDKVYSLTAKYPKSESYNMVSQIRRAAISVLANLVEGNSRSTKKDQANFTSMAYSSLMELLSLMIVSLDRAYINEVEYSEVRKKIDHISNQLNALKRTQLKSSTV